MQTTMTENRSLVDWRWWWTWRDMLRRAQGNVCGESIFLFLGCMASWMYTYVKSYQTVQINLCNLLCVDYTSMKLQN